MPETPYLSPQDVRGELAQFHRHDHRTLNTAFFGRGEPGTVTVPVKHEERAFDVVPVTCELQLRRALHDAEAHETVVALLVDYDERLPLDVQARLAGGRLQFISRERRLGNLFGVQRVTPTLVESPLADALLHAGWLFPAPKSATTIDLTTAWRHFLSKALGLPSDDSLTEEGVVCYLALHPPSSADPLLFKLLDDVPGFAAATEDFWEGTVGPVAQLCWTNWRAGRAADVASTSFVLDAVLGSRDEGAVKVFLSLRLKEFGEGKWISADPTLDRWARLAPALYLRLGDRAGEILRRADQFVDEPVLRGALVGSRFLTAGFAGMKAELAALLDAAVAGIDEDGAGVVQRAHVGKADHIRRKLEDHHLARAGENAASLERTLMGLRLLAYLSVRPNWAIELKDTAPVEPMFRLAESFAQEGGFVDHARTMVRGGHDGDPLDAAIGRVADAADNYRDQMDRRFARALALWNEDRRMGRVLPIEDALAELGVSFLTGGQNRRLLILLMDGMSWATAAELILDVRDLGYSPLRWQPPRALRPGLPAPMIAALPTMTEVSRAALFAGKLLQPGDLTSTVRDPERLNQHKAFVKAFGDGPTLLLRTEAESQTGHLTEAARKLVEGSDRAVGVVVNAVDDQLTSKPGYQVHANRTTIKALQPLLDLARESARAVLLIADHGHVTSMRPHTAVAAGKIESPRYREIDPDAVTGEREIVLSGQNVYTGRKGKRLAMLFSETDRYVSQRHIGEHGGASLAEVVTPALMLGSQDLRTLVGEEGEELDVVAYPIPAWWHLDLPVEKQATRLAATPKMPPKTTAAPKAIARESQLVLTALVPASEQSSAAPSTTASTTSSKWAARLGEVFADLERPRKHDLLKRVIPAVELLVEHSGRLAEDVFAGYLGEAPRNVGGRVALIAEFLNEDGYQVIEHDAVGKQVKLHIDLLTDIFGG